MVMLSFLTMVMLLFVFLVVILEAVVMIVEQDVSLGFIFCENLVWQQVLVANGTKKQTKRKSWLRNGIKNQINRYRNRRTAKISLLFPVTGASRVLFVETGLTNPKIFKVTD